MRSNKLLGGSMNWEAVGAVGETVGAFAVVATLIYLAIQTKQTRQAVEANGFLSTMEIYSRWRTAIVQSPDLAKMGLRGIVWVKFGTPR